MAIAKVGSAVTFNSGNSNITTTGQVISISPSAGNTIVAVVFMRGSTSSAVTITPTGGTATFTSRVAQLGNSVYIHIQTAHNVGSGITSLTIAPNIGARGMIWVQEYSGVDNTTPMDVSPVGAALSSSSTLTSPSISPVTQGAVVIAAYGNQAVSNTSSPFKATTAGPTAHSGTQTGGGWTSEFDLWSQASTSSNLVVGSNIGNTTSGAYQADWTPAVALGATAGAIALRPTVAASNPKAHTLVDAFDSEDTATWYGYDGAVASVVNGQLNLLAVEANSYYPPLQSVSVYDLTGSYVAFQLAQNLPEGNGTYTTLFTISADGTDNNALSMTIEGGNTYLSMKETVSGTASTATIAFNNLRFKWFRIRESGGTAYWETSIDGSTWVTRRSKTTTLTLTGVTVKFVAGCYGTESGAPAALIDNLNLNSGTAIGTDLPLPISVFTSDFSNTLDAGTWYTYGAVNTENGYLKMVPVSLDYAVALTNDTWDLRGDALSVELVQNANQGNGLITTEIMASVDSNNYVEFLIDGGAPSTITLREKVSGTNSDTTIVYDPAKCRWFRIRESSGTVYWETSPDGATWNIRRSKTTALTLSAVKIKFVTGSWDNETDLGVVLLDNLNIPNTALAKQQGWFVNTIPFGAVDGGTVQAKNFFDQADWLWQPIPDNPVLDPLSSEWGDELAAGSHSVSAYDFADTIILPPQITDSTPRYHMTWTGPTTHPDWGLTGDPWEGVAVPIPSGTKIPPGSDGHLCVLDPITGKAYSAWQAVYDSGTDSWSATWGSVTTLHGDGRDYLGTSTAANFSRAAGVVLENEIVAGEIPHAIFSASGSTGPDFRYPAQKSDGANLAGVAYPIPQGARVQLDPSIDLATIPNITPGELAVGRAMQKYGAYLGDQTTGGPGFGCQLQFIPTDTVDSNGFPTIPTPYQLAGFQWDYFDMSHIPWAGNVRVLRNWDGS